MESPAQTPTKTQNIFKDKQLTFSEALHSMIEGKKRVRRLEWRDDKVFLTFKDELLHIYKTDDKQLHPLLVCKADIVAKDWVVC